MRFKLIFLGLIVCLCGITFYFFKKPSSECIPKDRSIAITLDDVPAEDQATLSRIIAHLKHYHAPATLFVIARRMKTEDFSYLGSLRTKQFIIGNHSYSHPNLRRLSAADYIADIHRADVLLTSLMSPQKYYRYPYLAMGGWFKKNQVKHYLEDHHYTIAPVTVDSRDFVLNMKFCTQPRTQARINQMRRDYVHFIWQQTVQAERGQQCKKTKQVLLLHANTLNAYFLADVLKMYQQHGYHFISLPEAL